jgi:hypothetical protein
MSGLEVVGAAAIYIVAVIVAGYIGAGLTAFLTRKSGLEGLALIVVVPMAIWIVGAIVGLILLGAAIA